jgi:hypothetical protein
MLLSHLHEDKKQLERHSNLHEMQAQTMLTLGGLRRDGSCSSRGYAAHAVKELYGGPYVYTCAVVLTGRHVQTRRASQACIALLAIPSCH